MQKNEEFIELLKSAINENGLNTIPGDDLIEIYKRAKLIEASSNNLDIELSKAINTLLKEIKKRRLSPDTTPQKILDYKDSSFSKINEGGGSYKWVYAIAIPAIIIALVLIISNYSSDKTGTEAPKAPTFDIVGYYNEYKSYYGDIPLEDVAKHAFTALGYDKEYPDYESWKKDKGLEAIIQEDNDRRKPSFSSKLMGAIPFRYEEESIYGSLYRYDRFTKTVERRYGNNENSFKWVLKPQFKNLQHVRDYMAQCERNGQIWAIEAQTEELKRKQIVQQMQQPIMQQQTMQQQWEADR